MNVLDALEHAPSPSRRRFRSWAAAEPALAGLGAAELRGMLLDDTPPVDYQRRDNLLAALVRLARADTDAGQLLVVCLLPGIKARLRRHAQAMDRDEAAQEIVSAMWRRIRRYPLDRRPQKIALNLLLDTTHDFIAARDREAAWHDRSGLTDDPVDLHIPAPEQGLSPKLMWDEALRARVLSNPQVTLIDATRIRGLPLPKSALLLGINHEAAKKARRRGEIRFAAWWAPDDRRHAA